MRGLWLLPLLLGVFFACDDPGGLESVSGVQGMINFVGEKPDSIKALALVVLKPEAIEDLDHIANYLINYSEPLDQPGSYFIQLKPGVYLPVVVGLLVDPGLFVVNIDKYLEDSELPIVQLTQGAYAFPVRKNEMHTIDWDIQF